MSTDVDFSETEDKAKKCNYAKNLSEQKHTAKDLFLSLSLLNANELLLHWLFFKKMVWRIELYHCFYLL